MSRPDPRWQRYTRAAVDGTEPRDQAEGRADRPNGPTAGRFRGPRSTALRARIHELVTERDTAGEDKQRPRPDVRLLPAVGASWTGAAVGIAQPWQFSAMAAACSLALCAAAAAMAWRLQRSIRAAPVHCYAAGAPQGISTRRSRRRAPEGLVGAAATAALAALCLCVVLFAVTLRQHDRQTAPLALAVASGWQLSLTLEVKENPRIVAAGQGPAQVAFNAVILQATARGSRYEGPLPIRVMAGMGWLHVPAGARVSTAGTVVAGGLQEAKAGILRPSTAPLDVQAAAGNSLGLKFRAGWLAAAQRVWAQQSPDVAGLLPGMVMGDRSASPPGLDDAMKTVGLTHLTAVSGANCTLVLSTLLLFLRSLHTPRLIAGGMALLGLAGFVAIVGPDPSVLRAAVMGGIGCAAMLSGRPKRVGALLSASIVVLLVADPWLALDFAFILSVLATLGLHLMGKRCARWLGAWMPAWAAQAVAIPLAAQLFCAPVIVLLQPRLALFTVPANMAAAPVVALVTTVGTLGMVAVPLLPAVSSLCAWTSGWGAWWVAGVARSLAGMPVSSLPWPEGAEGVVLMALMNAALLAALAALVERKLLAATVQGLRGKLPERWRFLLGFGCFTVCTAVAAALWTAAVLGA